MILTTDDISQLETRYRANLFNSVAGTKTVSLIGTQSEAQVTNLAIFSSITHLGSNPPLFGIVVRPPQEVERHTLNNILTNHWYTINVVNTSILEKAHQTSAKYDAAISEFEAVGLTPYYVQDIPAPAVQECTISLFLKYLQHISLPNETIFVIGEVKHVNINEEFISKEGVVNHSLANSVSVGGLDTYYESILKIKLPYARPS
ncbi:MAG: flavin reductase family protein [Cytophagaceae bacterium]